MATLAASITLRDNMSVQLSKSSKALRENINGFERLGTTISRTESRMSSFFKNAMGKVGALAAAYLAFGTIGKAMALADSFAQTTARINLMNDNLQSTSKVQEMILASAMETGQKYADTADFVAKLGLLANNAFSNTKETVAFAEQISKHLQIAGTDTAAAAGSMLQLQQALSMNVLRGQEFNSVLQGMPTVIQAIEKNLGISRAELRNMANDGKITGDIIKEAIFTATDETNRKFAEMPITFASASNMIGSTLQYAFMPLWKALTNISNNGQLKSMLSSITPVITEIATGLAFVITVAKNFVGQVVPLIGAGFRTAGVIATNAINGIGAAIQIVFPLAIGLLAAYATGWVILNASMLANQVVTMAVAAWQAILAAGTWAVTTAKAAWTAITWGLTAAQLALGVALAIIASPIILIKALVVIVIGAFAMWVAASVDLREAVAKAMEGIFDITEWLVNSSVKLINTLINAYNTAGNALGKLLGYEFTAVGTIDYKADFSAARDKYAGAIRNGTFMQTIGDDIKSVLPKELAGGFGGGGGVGAPNPLEEMAKDGKKTAGNTKAIKDAMGILEEDLKHMRDIADKEYIQNNTYSNIKLDLSGSKTTINNKGDLDGYIDNLADYIADGIAAKAEGVHP